jgi:hypothetical protein
MEWIPFHKEMPPMTDSGEGVISDFILLAGFSRNWVSPCVGQVGLRTCDDDGVDFADGMARLEILLWDNSAESGRMTYLSPDDYPTHWMGFPQCPDEEAKQSRGKLWGFMPMHSQTEAV